MVVADKGWRLEPTTQNILLQWWLDRGRAPALIQHLGARGTERGLGALIDQSVMPVLNLKRPPQAEPMRTSRYEAQQANLAQEAIVLKASRAGDRRTRRLLRIFRANRIPVRIYTEEVRFGAPIKKLIR